MNNYSEVLSDSTARCAEVLAAHGFASVDDAREANVFHVCHVCGSIKTVTADNEAERREQALILWTSFEIGCCEDGDESFI